MPRRTKAELRQEFERLAAIFDVITDFEKANTSLDGIYDNLPGKEEMFAQVTSGQLKMSEIISGIEMAINDFQLGLEDFDPETHHLLAPNERGPNADKFFAFYHARMGCTFYQDVAPPSKIVKKILKRGAIAS